MSSTPEKAYNDAAGSGSPPARGRRSKVPLGRRTTALVLVVVLLAVGAILSERGAKGYYEFSPGDAPLVTASAACVQRGSDADLTLPSGGPCARLVVPPGMVSPVDGRIFMVDVLVGPAPAQDYALSKLGLLDRVHPGDQLVPAAEVLGTTPASQLGCQDAQEMTDSTQSAAVAALGRLGYHVGANELGARVIQVNPGSAASAAGVRCNDLVTAVGATPIKVASELAAAVHARRPGDRVTLTVRRTAADGATSTVKIAVTLGSVPAMPAIDGAPATPAEPGTAFLGVATEDDVTYTLPFKVAVKVGDIGGPSAGLALTLGLLDVLSHGHLTGGRSVAATGTIAPDGTVGDVGGVAQKTIAVRRAGAQLFLVPIQELAVARREADGMQVEAVTSLAQAITDLEQIGGSLRPGAVVQAAPRAGSA